MQVRGMDHIVLNVADGERSVAWYRDVLGLEVLRYTEWKAGEVPFVSLKVSETCIIDLFEVERTGENLNHFALFVEGEVDELLARDDVEIAREPRTLWGAQGNGPSVSIYDPDRNMVELKRY
ncbi:MAG: VOC family protein [Actinomycetota bacterium]|jgi:catechol 2,3-dioxygenase-like lactoylglutathione lyase family enzyme|nr:VOC family protein [Actinomycetota bacterium]